MSDRQTQKKARAYAAAVDELLVREFRDSYLHACMIVGGRNLVVDTIMAHAASGLDGFTLVLQSSNDLAWSLTARPQRPGTFGVRCTLHQDPSGRRQPEVTAKSLRINLELERIADDVLGPPDPAATEKEPPLMAVDLEPQLRAVLSIARTVVGGTAHQQRLGLETVVDRMQQLVDRCERARTGLREGGW
jgi:hypothetical protein